MNPKPTVLLVEDNEDDAALAEMALARSGHEHSLRLARDGQEAIEILREFSAKGILPAVVLLDLKLPRVDGRGVLRELRGDPTMVRVPVVVLTSSRLEQDVLDAYALGANSYFQKPVDFASFERDMALLLTTWLQLNVAPGRERVMTEGHHRRVAADAKRAPGPDVNAVLAHPPGILVIDGIAEDRARTIATLESVVGEGTVVGFSSIAETAALYARLGGPPPFLAPDAPRLIFVDPDLPDGNGQDLLQSLRYRSDHHTVLVVFTRNTSPDWISECHRLKVNSVVLKPEDPAAYADTVRLLGHYWSRMNERPPAPSKAMRAVAHPG